MYPAYRKGTYKRKLCLFLGNLICKLFIEGRMKRRERKGHIKGKKQLCILTVRILTKF